MTRQLLLFGILLTYAVATVDGQPAAIPREAKGGKASDIHAANKKLGRGINLGNALEAPKEGEWGVKLKAEYFKTIKEAGFQSVRLPVRWSAHAKTDAPYAIDVKFAERMDWAI